MTTPINKDDVRPGDTIRVTARGLQITLTVHKIDEAYWGTKEGGTVYAIDNVELLDRPKERPDPCKYQVLQHRDYPNDIYVWEAFREVWESIDGVEVHNDNIDMKYYTPLVPYVAD